MFSWRLNLIHRIATSLSGFKPSPLNSLNSPIIFHLATHSFKVLVALGKGAFMDLFPPSSFSENKEKRGSQAHNIWKHIQLGALLNSAAELGISPMLSFPLLGSKRGNQFSGFINQFYNPIRKGEITIPNKTINTLNPHFFQKGLIKGLD